ncbi:hypothetical protein PybrP1_012603 [[Pythium] brassicae (nom. inval.)]|nr:hypothetical protein PybrP1_012603 [[Pythium] brassicae (nom. inval.)]
MCSTVYFAFSTAQGSHRHQDGYQELQCQPEEGSTSLPFRSSHWICLFVPHNPAPLHFVGLMPSVPDFFVGKALASSNASRSTAAGERRRDEHDAHERTRRVAAAAAAVGAGGCDPVPAARDGGGSRGSGQARRRVHEPAAAAVADAAAQLGRQIVRQAQGRGHGGRESHQTAAGKGGGRGGTETFKVASLDDLPYAANKVTQFGGLDAVIAFDFLNLSNPLFPALAATLAKASIDISVKNRKPVVRGLFIGEPRVASVKAKSGYGAEFAEGIDALIRLGN